MFDGLLESLVENLSVSFSVSLSLVVSLWQRRAERDIISAEKFKELKRNNLCFQIRADIKRQ